MKHLFLSLLLSLPLAADPFVAAGSNGEKVNSSPFLDALGGTTAGKALFQAADAAAQRTALGLVIGTDVLAPNGSGAALTGTAAGLTAGSVTTIPNLTGVVTSTGNATAIADNALSIANTNNLQTSLDAKANLSGGNTLSGAQTYSGTLATTNTTDSTSTATGAITTAGGLGVEKDVFVGGNINFATSGKGIKGTATNNSAAAGVVGEFQANTVFLSGAIALTSGVALDITSITLTAGDWDVDGAVSINFSSATVSDLRGIAGTVSGTFDNTGLTAYGTSKPAGTGGSETLTLPRRRISASTTTTVYLIGRSTFSAGSAAAFGHIYARRIR